MVTLTEDQKREKLAEADGITNINTVCWRGHKNNIEVRIPDYFHDLNAIEALEDRHKEQLAKGGWVKILNDVCYEDWPDNDYPERARARHRAETMGRFLKLWASDK